MKKIVLLTAFTSLALCNTSFSQITSFAPEVGVNFANHVGDINSDMKVGIKVGLNVNVAIQNNWFFQPGLYFNSKGSLSETKILGVNTKVTTNANYLEMPLNFLYRVPTNNGGLFFSAGPYLGFGIGGEVKTDISGGPFSSNTSSKINWGSQVNEMKPLDIGFNAGIGYEFGMGLYIRGQYGRGFTTISNNDKSVMNQTLQLSVGYKILAR